MTNTNPAIPAPPPPPPPLPLNHHGVQTATSGELTPTPRSRLRRLQWVKIPAGRVAGSGHNVWNDVNSRFGSCGSPPRLDFTEMEELFRVAEPSVTVNGIIRRQQSNSPSEDVSISDRNRNRDEVCTLCTRFLRNVQGDSDKIPQHKNRNISEMCGNFCTKFCSFVQNKTTLKCVASCFIYSTYVKMTQTRTLRRNFATEQKAGFIKVTQAATTTFVGNQNHRT